MGIVVNFRSSVWTEEMGISRRSIARVGLVIMLALAGAALMIRMDGGGTVWLKFALYAASIVGAYLLMFVPGAASCGWQLFRRQSKS